MNLPLPGGRASGAAEWLRLAAAPTFAAMAVLTGLLEAGRADPLCSAAGEAFPLSGMATMYLLMTVFHLAPWLQRVGRRPRAGEPNGRLRRSGLRRGRSGLASPI